MSRIQGSTMQAHFSVRSKSHKCSLTIMNNISRMFVCNIWRIIEEAAWGFAYQCHLRWRKDAVSSADVITIPPSILFFSYFLFFRTVFFHLLLFPPIFSVFLPHLDFFIIFPSLLCIMTIQNTGIIYSYQNLLQQYMQLIHYLIYSVFNINIKH